MDIKDKGDCLKLLLMWGVVAAMVAGMLYLIFSVS